MDGLQVETYTASEWRCMYCRGSARSGTIERCCVVDGVGFIFYLGWPTGAVPFWCLSAVVHLRGHDDVCAVMEGDGLGYVEGSGDAERNAQRMLGVGDQGRERS